jgi:hypothetical protein
LEHTPEHNRRSGTWWLIAAVAAAVLLALPTLRGGWIVDDYYHKWANVGSQRFAEILPSRWDIFRFGDANEIRTNKMVDMGLFAWWTYPQARAAFWRPVTAATHVLDYTLWPDNPALMHAQSILWYAALIACVWLLYRCFGGGAAAGLATLLFALDSGHAMPVGMLANRNALVSACFGVLAILAHDKWRRDGWRWGAVLAPALVATSLLSAEAGMGVFAYLIAYEFALEQGGWRRRLAAFLPYVAVGAIWQLLWRLRGYGVEGIGDGLYLDPARHPIDFLRHSIVRFPTLMEGLWGPVPADTYLILGPTRRLCLAAAGVLMIIIVGWMLWRILRSQPSARFYALGMLISLVPACGMASQNRQMVFAGIGAMGLMGMFLAAVWKMTFWQDSSKRVKVTIRALAVLMVIVHGVLAPVAFGLTSTYAFGNPHLFSFLEEYPDMDSWTLSQDLVTVTSPAADFVAHMVAPRDMAGKPLPGHIRTLASAWSDVTVTRLDEQTLVLRPDGGFLRELISLGRDKYHPMHQGQVVRLTGVTITVGPLNSDNRPAEATFRFDVPLEDASLTWVYWDQRAFKKFTVPQVGRTITIPGIRLHI